MTSRLNALRHQAQQPRTRQVKVHPGSPGSSHPPTRSPDASLGGDRPTSTDLQPHARRHSRRSSKHEITHSVRGLCRAARSSTLREAGRGIASLLRRRRCDCQRPTARGGGLDDHREPVPNGGDDQVAATRGKRRPPADSCASASRSDTERLWAAGGLRPIFSAEPTGHVAHRAYARFSHSRGLHERSSEGSRQDVSAGPVADRRSASVMYVPRALCMFHELYV